MSSRISAAAVLALVVLAGFQNVKSQSRSSSFNGFALVDKAGNIRKPSDYRDRFEALGSWTVIDPKGDQIHFVYASPGASEYYRANGHFADGTMLVKEIWGTDHAQLTTGDAHWMSKIVQWFVLVKDAKGRFPGNSLWGNGWGWALFKADAPEKQVATDFKKDCLSCHVPAKDTDWIYVKGYPVLGSAK